MFVIKKLVLVSSFLFISTQLLNAQDVKILDADLSAMIGSWEGELVFVSYRDGQENAVVSNLEITATDLEGQLQVQQVYPNNLDRNKTYFLTLTENGTILNTDPVISRKEKENGSIEFTVEFSGKDAGKKARIRNIFTISRDSLTIRKEVKFKKGTEWFKRNQQHYTRKE